MSKISEFKSIIPGREESAVQMYDFSRTSNKNNASEAASSSNKVVDTFSSDAATPVTEFTSLLNGRKGHPIR